MRTLFRWSGSLIALCLLLIACAIPSADAAGSPPDTSTVTQLLTSDDVARAELTAGYANIESGRALGTAQATRPADSVLFDEMQVSLKSLAWRATDGKFRVTNRENGAGPWEANVRDAVWKGLFYTTQGPAPSGAPATGRP